jgi:hypothetical protein
MTAEIAILNKSAVALAADSAVTISAGSKEQKIFDSADKLFELSPKNPIGVMIYNGMGFMEVPLPSLIRSFRAKCTNFKTVKDAALSFLNYLDAFGREAPQPIKDGAVRDIVRPILEGIRDRYTQKLHKKLMEPGPPPR